MAFRSELDAMRERADEAEAESRRLATTLEEERARIERITEVEAQLETAQRQLREGKSSPKKRAGETLLMLGIGCAIGLGVMVFWSSLSSNAARDAEVRAEARRAAEYRALDDAADEARQRTALVETERDDVRAAHESTTDEFREIILALTGGAAAVETLPGRPVAEPVPGRPVSLGPVTAAEGPAPTHVGAFCELVERTGETPCAARIVCDRETVYDVGCGLHQRRALRTYGGHLEIQSPDRAWTVTIDTTNAGRGGAAPAGYMGVAPRPLAP